MHNEKIKFMQKIFESYVFFVRNVKKEVIKLQVWQTVYPEIHEKRLIWYSSIFMPEEVRIPDFS